MKPVGYTYLAQLSDIQAIMPETMAEVRSVTRKEVIGPIMAVPAKLAPGEQDILGHILFGLKHEGVNLSILAQALPKVPEPELRAAFDASPSSQYLRRACYLWEYFSGRVVHRQCEAIRQAYVPLFDPALYVTASTSVRTARNARWRVTFNGLGTLDYCVTVRRTPELQALLNKRLLQKATEFTASLPKAVLNRTLAWAYLHETRDSYAIENEAPSENKATRFVNLLRQAHNPRKLDEDYLVELQNATISNVYGQAASFRTQQNYLSNGLRGALGVTYLPPPPVLGRELMDDLMALANGPPEGVDPLVLAAIVSFGFVFIHPFMDGNGRLSRFLFHQVLCQQGSLENGLVLPVSMVLRQNEAEYLASLQVFSEPVRRLWEVTFIDEDQYQFEFKGHEAVYRYWDGTRGAEFMAQAADQAIEQHLKEETLFLIRYDEIYRYIDRAYDIPNSDLAKLVLFCMDQRGRLSKNRRKQYQYVVPSEVFDALERAYHQVVGSTPE
ncbi:Fic family protein [Marinimicrobium agarilyticum]|uniref:Fic family protein n=1 Tax=Marinimicrobium agarilyticum TaxID=306546 RepID=UPI00041FF39D|nr:Fic family protein [Marinimicrobium agarilyticum]